MGALDYYVEQSCVVALQQVSAVVELVPRSDGTHDPSFLLSE